MTQTDFEGTMKGKRGFSIVQMLILLTVTVVGALWAIRYLHEQVRTITKLGAEGEAADTRALVEWRLTEAWASALPSPIYVNPPVLEALGIGEAVHPPANATGAWGSLIVAPHCTLGATQVSCPGGGENPYDVLIVLSRDPVAGDRLLAQEISLPREATVTVSVAGASLEGYEIGDVVALEGRTGLGLLRIVTKDDHSFVGRSDYLSFPEARIAAGAKLFKLHSTWIGKDSRFDAIRFATFQPAEGRLSEVLAFALNGKTTAATLQKPIFGRNPALVDSWAGAGGLVSLMPRQNEYRYRWEWQRPSVSPPGSFTAVNLSLKL
jgi:hypothetical protein